ncbi:hypothetical protein VUR80DRAFT_2297 [Thermomyces stellatus]
MSPGGAAAGTCERNQRPPLAGISTKWLPLSDTGSHSLPLGPPPSHISSVLPELPIGRTLASVYFARRSYLETRTSCQPHPSDRSSTQRVKRVLVPRPNHAHTLLAPVLPCRHPSSIVNPRVRRLGEPTLPEHRPVSSLARALQRACALPCLICARRSWAASSSHCDC